MLLLRQAGLQFADMQLVADAKAARSSAHGTRNTKKPRDWVAGSGTFCQEAGLASTT